MSLELIHIEPSDKEILNKFRLLNSKSKKVIQKQIDELLEKIEDEEDLKDARERMKEKSIPASEVYNKLGI